MNPKDARLLFCVAVLLLSPAVAGPYKEPGVCGYVDGDGRPAAPGQAGAIVNPIFRGWATGVVSYQPSPQTIQAWWKDPTKALGPATGNNTDIVSLGDLDSQQLDQGLPPGRITLSFGQPICNGKGFDFAVFENGLVCEVGSPGGGVAGELFAELGYVEVSTNGQDFARFPSVSLTASAVGAYGTIDPENVYNLAGRCPNGGNVCLGTPFDLNDIQTDALVVSGIVNINNINYVRIVDIPGRGDYADQAVEHIDPCTWPVWDYFEQEHPVYDAWLTWGSGGFDLEAIGVLHEQQYAADINLDGQVDFCDFAIFASCWQSHFGQENYLARCDIAEPRDYVIDGSDMLKFGADWLKVESWIGQ